VLLSPSHFVSVFCAVDLQTSVLGGLRVSSARRWFSLRFAFCSSFCSCSLCPPNLLFSLTFPTFTPSPTAPTVEPLWTTVINPSSERLVSFASRNTDERVASLGDILPDRTVMYKYLNPNLVAMATMSPYVKRCADLTVYLLDAVKVRRKRNEKEKRETEKMKKSV
jgi:hypothetical protein